MKLETYQCDWKGCKTTWKGDPNPLNEPCSVLIPTGYHKRQIAEDDSGPVYTSVNFCPRHSHLFISKMFCLLSTEQGYVLVKKWTDILEEEIRTS